MARNRRDRRPADDGGADRWLGTYGDMVTLLMAFFVMLYAISQVDDVKFAELVSGLDVFGNTTNLEGAVEGGPALLNEGGSQNGIGPGELLNEVMRDAVAPNRQEDNAAAGKATEEPTERTSEQAARQEERASREEVERVARQLEAALDRARLPRRVADVRGDPRGVVISVSSDDLHFALGSTEISRFGQRIIGAIASVIRRYDAPVVVEGHTDNLPLRRAGYTNWNLSTDRAVAVVERLQHVHDIDQRRLAATGYGEYQPRVPNSSASQRARNRRVDVLLRLNGE